MLHSGASVGAFAPGTISFDWEPDPEVVAAEYMVTAGRLEDRSQPLLLSARIARADTTERFETQTDPDGYHWQEWSDNYRPYAEATNQGEILQQFMTLQDAATSSGSYPITADSVFINTGGWPEYWSWHQTGKVRQVSGEGGGAEAGEAEGIASALGISLAEAREMMREEAGTSKKAGIGINVLPRRAFLGPSLDAQLRMVEVFNQWFGGVIEETFTRGGRVVAVRRGAGGKFIKGGQQIIG